MKRTLLFVVFFVLVSNSFSQYLSDTSIVYPQIKSFLRQGLKDTTTSPMPLIYHENLLDSNNNVFGVFIFRPLTSVDRPRIYLRDIGKTKIEILKEYNIDSVIEKVTSYYRKNSAAISYTQKIICMRKVLEILEWRLR